VLVMDCFTVWVRQMLNGLVLDLVAKKDFSISFR
jgi:hypothetical protein